MSKDTTTQITAAEAARMAQLWTKEEPAPQVRSFIALGNYGWNFGTLAKRLRGRHKERWQQGRYNRFVRTQRPPRFWTADDWQERCAAIRRAGL